MAEPASNRRALIDCVSVLRNSVTKVCSEIGGNAVFRVAFVESVIRDRVDPDDNVPESYRDPMESCVARNSG